jgi:hypothetical protein
MKVRRLAVCLVITLYTLALLAQSPKVQRITSAPDGVSTDTAAALEDKGYRVMLDDGWTADLWVAKNAKLSTGEAAGALYPELSNSEFVGVLHLPKGMGDFRGQAVSAGTYTLRYQLLPQDANHLGVSPNPDFLLAIPAATDNKPDSVYAFDKLVALSAKSTGAHPAVIALDKAGEPGTAKFDDQQQLILTVNVSSGTGKPLPIGIVLKGQAAQ